MSISPGRNRIGTSSHLHSVRRSLSDLVGEEYMAAVCAARAFLTGTDPAYLTARAATKIDFAPTAFLDRCNALVGEVGARVSPAMGNSARGAGTRSFDAATRTAAAPIGGFGFTRVGEDGRLYLVSKSEHYHASLGHEFPGYELVEIARSLGISNVTHNNTRGHVTRTLERELIRCASGVPKEDTAGLDRILGDTSPHVLNRVINLETGSLAVEAALKMMLARFFRLDDARETPPYDGKIPVFLVVGDFNGGIDANYHGTTILTQMMRGLWPLLRGKMEAAEIFLVRPVGINDADSFRAVVEEYDVGRYKVAGFFHEIVLMNYGAVLLSKEFLQTAYDICHEHDIPVIVDEIQSCMWSPELFLFREYGLTPDFVSVGKGFPGGHTPASRIITTAPMDNLNQFGALVTNGQEELASLYYLVTMSFVQENGPYIGELGEYYHAELERLAARYPQHIDRIEGLRHLSSIYFHDEEAVTRFVRALNDACIDISSQAYKVKAPPAALTKLPLIATPEMVDFLIDRMDMSLRAL